MNATKIQAWFFRFQVQSVHLLFILTSSISLISACSSVQNFVKANIQRPRVTFAGARLDGLSLEAVDLLFDLKISNPNPVGIKLAGFDYDFLLNGSGFVHGEQDRALEIPAHGENIVQIPLSLRFAEVYKTFKSLRDQDTTRYQINAGVSFELPFLGKQRIPVSKEGTIPLLKLPKLRVESLKLNGLSLSGADLQLNVLLKNPNVFSFTLNRIGYQLEINDKRWMTGDLEKRIQIPEKDESALTIPISLNFFQIGQSVYQLLTDDKPLTYHFRGSFRLASSLPLLHQVNIPFDRSGQIRVIK